MPRAVSPWTWGKALRDHGPSDRDFLCAMLILRTYMDQDGFAYPSLRTWAGGARMSVNTLRKHVEAASTAGWINVESRAGQRRERVRHVYRCTIPDHIVLDDKDEEIAGAIAVRAGAVGERRVSGRVTESLREPFEAPSVSLMIDTDAASCTESVSPHADTDKRDLLSMHSRPADEAPSVSNAAPICVRPASDLCQTDGSSVSPMVDTEVLKSPEGSLFEGAAATARTCVASKKTDCRDEERARRQKASTFLKAAPTTDDRKVASMFSLTLDDIRHVRAELTEST